MTTPPNEPASENAPEKPGLILRLRMLMRVLAAAVYAKVAFALIAGWLPASPIVFHLVQAACVFTAGAILAAVVEGSIAELGFAGLAVAIADAGLVWFFADEPPAILPFVLWQLVNAVDLTLAGLLGAFAVLRRRARSRSEAPAAGTS